MEQNIIITIGFWKFICGFASLASMIVVAAWKFSGRLGKTDGLIEGIVERLKNLEMKNTGTASTSSPIKLLEKGERILNESGLKKFIDDNKEKFLNDCKSSCNINTAYDVQTISFDFFDKLKFENNFEKKLKEIAFKEGLSVDIIRRIGGIYFRDVCLENLSMKLDDIDKH